jgi:hypothetical protein
VRIEKIIGVLLIICAPLKKIVDKYNTTTTVQKNTIVFDFGVARKRGKTIEPPGGMQL